MKKSRKDDVINIASCMIRKQGFSNLTFSQIAKELDITRENVHHYFKKKEDLGNASLELMAEDLQAKFDKIFDSSFSSIQKLEEYFKIYKFQQNEKEDCPIVSLLAEYEILPLSMQKQVELLSKIEQENMEKILEEGLKTKQFNISSDISFESKKIIAFLKGAVSYCKIYDNFELMCESLIKDLTKE